MNKEEMLERINIELESIEERKSKLLALKQLIIEDPNKIFPKENLTMSMSCESSFTSF